MGVQTIGFDRLNRNLATLAGTMQAKETRAIFVRAVRPLRATVRSEAPVNDLEQELTPVLTKAKDQLKQVLSKAKAKRCKICEESGVDSGTHATKDHPRPARA